MLNAFLLLFDSLTECPKVLENETGHFTLRQWSVWFVVWSTWKEEEINMPTFCFLLIKLQLGQSKHYFSSNQFRILKNRSIRRHWVAKHMIMDYISIAAFDLQMSTWSKIICPELKFCCLFTTVYTFVALLLIRVHRGTAGPTNSVYLVCRGLFSIPGRDR